MEGSLIGTTLKGPWKELVPADRKGYLIQRFRANGFSSSSNGDAEEIVRSSLANEISSYLFGYLNGFRIPTHFVQKAGDSAMLVIQLRMIPLVLKIWNVATGALARRLAFREGTPLAFPVLEHYYKKPELSNPFVNDFHLYSLAVVTPEQLKQINRLGSKANAVLRSLFERRGLKLVAATFEFGTSGDQLMLGDEISLRTCQVVDLLRRVGKTKDIFNTRGGSIEAYRLFRDRLLGSV